MRISPKTYPILLALLAATALATCAADVCATALADSGGSAAPAESTAATGTTPATPAHATSIATWFGPGFYGKQTACGQTLTPGVVGVANRTLPCGTLVQVTYRGHSLTVPVLDRGPYGHAASWDLTAGAASALGITETVRIATHVVGKAANTPSLGLPPVSPSTAQSGGALAG
jgi:rare lipoprotein A (peptidoglycan hydrolase)